MNINSKEFILPSIPQLHPLSSSYTSFWREQKRRCIEGYWVGGYYMPPALYFYINFATIRLNKKPYSPKSWGRPHLRDIDWDFFRHYTEARGFSGFLLDDVYSSNRILLDSSVTDEFLLKFYPNTISSTGSRKLYIPAREALAKQYPASLGAPLFENPFQNFMMMGGRNFGKSYSVGAGIIPHTFLFDGATSYSLDQPSPVELIVGAHSSDKSADLLKKSKDSMEMLPGKLTISSRTYPSPFSKRIQGSWDVNREIVATYKKRTQGGWENAGSKSSIKHRSFNSNPFAAQGTRPMLLVLEEIGMFANLKEVYLHTVDALRNGLTKTGMLLMLGTGGDMDRGTIDAAEMFYSPEKYDILPFKDEWENGKDIGYFVPAYLSLPEFKDDNGVTDIPAAKQALLNNRDKLRKGKGGSEALNQEIQYKPLVPSEMFLARRAHIFPSAEIQRRLSEIISQDLYYKAEKKVDLFFDPTSPYNGVSYKIDHSLTPITSFPHTDPNVEGAVVIYELPHLQDGAVPPGAYIIGCDPFKEDDPTSSSFSLASIYVMKTSKYYSTIGHDEIVASYLGRPYMGKNAVNEVLYKLSLFYGNAKIYFENSVGNVKDYFEKIRRLDLLAAQPVTIFNKKASHRTAPSVIYGYPISNDKVKWEAIQYLRSWLLEVRDEETNTRNLDHILDPGLLQELLSFRMGSSEFDRVMSLVACSIGLEELHNLNKRSLEHEVQTLPLQKEFNDFIVNNKRLFNPINNVSTPTPTF